MAPAYRKILFATDLSDLSFEAWPHAVALAEKLGASISAVSVIEEPFALAPYDTQGVILQMLLDAKPQVARQLRERTQAHPATVRVETAVLEAASPARALLDHAKRERCDLIVVASHGRSGLGHLLLGSVAEKLVRLSPIPVLVVRQTVVPQKAPTP